MTAFLCLVVAHLEWPLIVVLPLPCRIPCRNPRNPTSLRGGAVGPYDVTCLDTARNRSTAWHRRPPSPAPSRASASSTAPRPPAATYRNLSEPATPRPPRRRRRRSPMRDGVTLLADVHRPDGDGRFPALIAASPYPRQIQDLGAPMGFIEAGATDFWVPRGYVHVIANLRGTGGSGGDVRLLRRPGTPRHVRPRRVGGRAAVVRRQRRHDRHQLLRDDPARGRRRAAAAPEGDLPGRGHHRPLRGGAATTACSARRS